MTKDHILREFEMFSLDGTNGITNWLTEQTDDAVFRRLDEIDTNPLSSAQLNQFLVLALGAPFSEEFFGYYWLRTPSTHPYDVSKLPYFDSAWLPTTVIRSLDHLKWGLYRIFVDGLLWFGDVGMAYRTLSRLEADLERFFKAKRFDTESMKARGPALPLRNIAKDDRYLISEMACKSYGERPDTPGELKNALLSAFDAAHPGGSGPITIRRLLEGELIANDYGVRQGEFIFSADDVLDESVSSRAELEQKYERVAKSFFAARESALANTRLYLSAVANLDVYVATSMRKREDFRDMASICEMILGDARLRDLEIRLFDPTLSAARGHEDKGLIECLMVKCAKVLVYSAGDSESWGKDAEAAMGLSLGKPVIFYCDQEQRSRFYRDIHPLSRLVDFSTGVAVGAIVTDNLQEVPELLNRIFRNDMEYLIELTNDGYLRLREALTSSVIRLQSNDQLLTETFWNHYHLYHL